MNKLFPILFVVAVICLAGGFFAGWQYEKTQSPFGKMSQNNGQQRFQGMANGNRTADGFINGEILSKDSQSITLKLRDGGSKIIFFSTSTEVSKFASGSVEDLSVGASIMAQGKANTDGSITAQTIQLRPASLTPAPPTQ